MVCSCEAHVCTMLCGAAGLRVVGFWRQKAEMNNQELTEWLKSNRYRLSVNFIEKEIGCPSTTLNKVITGTMKLAKKNKWHTTAML